MKKRFLVVGIVMSCFSMTSFGQQQSTAIHVSPKAITAFPTLKEQSEKINQKEGQIQQAAASSRGQMAQFKEELSVLLGDYKNMLVKEISNCAVDHVRAELETELAYVEQQLIPVTNQR